ncbi:MAG: prepilin peptidase [Erysipelotrichia bacterium]|nr:prepilin peptidase [Erysipelotrichia bacterium]
MSIYGDTFITCYVLILSFILGTVFGSFINCMASRIAEGKNWISGRSHCDSCGHVLQIQDLVPVFSYLFLHGKCRYCGTKMDHRYMLTEIGMGMAFVGVVLHYGQLNVFVLRDWALTCVLLGLSLVDLQTYEIPDGFIIAGLIIYAASIPFSGVNPWEYMKSGLLGGAVISGSMLMLSLIMDKILKKDTLGGGDVKLLFMSCLYLGLGSGLFCLILACILGLIFVVLLKKEKIAFGPSISLAVYTSLIVGPAIVSWYLSLF